jgi:3-isopropylmalate/(R)-2-methylmalate dehydratase small subunit
MKQISNEFSGTFICLDKSNVDTDQIIPKQFLKSIKKTGFGDNLFDGWRYLDEGTIDQETSSRMVNKDFIFNNKLFADSNILVSGENFGCGSSREHAVWALKDFGIKTVIAESFADIFYNNCFKNGLLALCLKKSEISKIFENFNENSAQSIEIDLINQVLYYGDSEFKFELDVYKKKCLLEGLDEIGASLKFTDQIKSFEKNYQIKNPWLFK